MRTYHLVFAAALALLSLAGSGAAAVPVSEIVTVPACATTPVRLHWSSEYGPGRYELTGITLTGLEGCHGAALSLTVGTATASQPYLQEQMRVRGDRLEVDVTGLGIPAADVDRISIVLEVSGSADEPRRAGGAEEGTGSFPAAEGSASGSASTLPETGASPTPWILLAVALILTGSWLRRRPARKECSDA